VPGAIAASRSGWVTHAPFRARADEYPPLDRLCRVHDGN
jgi:hypothetical protein